MLKVHAHGAWTLLCLLLYMVTWRYLSLDKHRMVPPFLISTAMATESRGIRIQLFLIENKRYLSQQHIYNIKEQLFALSDEQFEQIGWMSFKDPLVLLIVSLFFGMLGIDRLLLGETGKGIAKCLTSLLGVGLIWWVFDLLTVSERTTDYNYARFQETLSQITGSDAFS